MPAPPVHRDDEVELHVDSLAFGGNGVARLDGFVVFVRAGLPGDTVRARVTKVQRRHAEAITTEVVEPGPVRVDYPCAHYPTCGGCRFQDLAYEAQLAAKHAWVGRLAHAGSPGIAEPPLEPIVAAQEVFHYRNKMEYSFAPGRRRADARAARRRPLGQVLEIERCWLTTDLGNRIRNTMRDWAREEKLPAFDQGTGRATCGISSCARA